VMGFWKRVYPVIITRRRSSSSRRRSWSLGPLEKRIQVRW
jgi:hypothetical protein